MIAPTDYFFACKEARRKTLVEIEANMRRDEPHKLKKSDRLYNEMYKDQGGMCQICGCKETVKANGRIKRLSIDHCHTTGIIRGLLCNACNAGLGMFRDDTNRMENAIKYLGGVKNGLSA